MNTGLSNMKLTSFFLTGYIDEIGTDNVNENIENIKIKNFASCCSSANISKQDLNL